MPRILVLTTEPLPVADLPATGAGLRAWGLAQGLRTAGHTVRLLMPAEATATFGAAAEHSKAWPDWVGTFRRAQVRGAVAAENPDAVVLQHWGMARELGELDCPLAIDLAGPHLLERRLWGSGKAAAAEADLREKLDALRRADCLTCSGRLQRLYFLPYLAMAGWDITQPEALPVIPFSLEPRDPPAPVRRDRLVYGGFFLPWQNPSPVLTAALEALEAAGRGELVFVGGPHPALDVSRGKFEPLLQKLGAHPQVRMFPPMGYRDYLALLDEGGVALDLMERNAEREIAFTTRTVAYLAAGLPVVHDNYSELGDLITRAGAGWTFDPDDHAAIRYTLEAILEGLIDVRPRAQAAHALVENELHWDKTITPLAKWCADPQFRADKTAVRLAFEEQGDRLVRAERALEETRAELATLRGKRWVRWGQRLVSGGWWARLPVALLTALLVPLLLVVFWVNDLGTRTGHGQAPTGTD